MNTEFVSILKAVLATLLYLIGIELIGAWYLLVDSIGFHGFDHYYLLTQGTLQLIGVLIFLYLIKKRTFKKLLKKTHVKWFVFAFLLGVSFVFIQSPLKWIYNLLFGTDYYIAYRFDGLPNFNNINIIAGVILVPIGEELFFREYIQKNLQKKTNAVVAVLAASLLFALIHSPYLNLIFEASNEDWHLFYLTLFGGLIAGFLYIKSKSIGPPIVFHSCWNLMVFIV